MKRRPWALGLAILAQVALLTTVPTLAQDSNPSSAPASPGQRSSARQAMEWSRDRLSELDAAIAVLEQDAAKLQGDGRARAEAALKELRETREAYRIKADDAMANARTWTDAQVADARKSLDENWAAFEAKLDAYLDKIEADLATRRAVLEAEFEARQRAWQRSIDELRAEADKLVAKEKADIETRISVLKAQADQAKARVGRLQEASRGAWETAKRSYADTQKLFFDTYDSIRKSIWDATR